MMGRMLLFKKSFRKSLFFAFHYYLSLQLVHWGWVAEPSLLGLASLNMFTLETLVIILGYKRVDMP